MYHSREALYSNSADIAWWLQSTSAQMLYPYVTAKTDASQEMSFRDLCSARPWSNASLWKVLAKYTVPIQNAEVVRMPEYGIFDRSSHYTLYQPSIHTVLGHLASYAIGFNNRNQYLPAKLLKQRQVALVSNGNWPPLLSPRAAFWRQCHYLDIFKRGPLDDAT